MFEGPCFWSLKQRPRDPGFPTANHREVLQTIVNPKKLETGLRTSSAGIPWTEAVGFPTFVGLLLYLRLGIQRPA